MFIALAFFLFMSFFLSGSETALTAVNRMKVRFRANDGDVAAQKLDALLQQPDRMITAILIGNNIANIMLPTLVTMIAIEKSWQVGLATGTLTIILIIFGEVLPKTIAATFADKIAYVVAPVIRVLVFVLTPLTFLLSKFTNLFIRIISKGQVTEATLTKDDLRSMVDLAQVEGAFEKEETERIKGILDFPEKDVLDVMETHRTDVIALTLDATYEEARDTVLQYFYTRYPVYEESIDKVVGIFYSKKLIEWSMHPNRPMKQYIDMEPLFVVQTMSVETVFRLMLAHKKHMAIILDEYGGTLGIVTQEDIIEEMIGQEIEDETDLTEEQVIYFHDDHTLICSGRLDLEDAMELLEIELPDENETIGGFFMQEFGRIPEVGDTLNYHHHTFTIDEMERSRIMKMTIRKEEVEEKIEE
ncbi:DUF21 domain-containing protein [Savagea sp. SN6]|uniref:DUF21 domain-containing protein n=1 Tax=Savagea serpentis TaxID=2785297 RepID=A0A8J7G3C1_9BACL|nr:CNNM domain-containing protein [Savagea serpentis]MBF4501475.1 DUF21 domain-containing protein [Savagea serpentis]